MKVLIATTNTGKRKEFTSLLDGEYFDLVFPDDLGINLEVAETGSTYTENALLKARALCKASGLITLADDTGLEVDALNGRPGLYSARYARETAKSDQDRRAHLLQELASHPRPWTARFVCVAALAHPAGEIATFEGSVSGDIIPQERGDHGFGYDRIFYIPAAGKTMAELTLEEKNNFSHRAMAVNLSVPQLLAWGQSC
jgi:XTP/dITP diphosphohydrolase